MLYFKNCEIKLINAPTLLDVTWALALNPNVLIDLDEADGTLPAEPPGVTLTPEAGVRCQVG